MDPIVARARALAESAHAGQVDQQGRPYFDAHLIPIAAALAPIGGPVAEALGLLHDIIEDTDVTADDLRADGFSDFLVGGIIAVTRDFFGPETYHSGLIVRSCAHPVGRLGKLVDNTWNILCNAGLALVDPSKADSLLNGRYLPARRMLLDGSGLLAQQVFEMEMTLRGHLIRLERTYG